MSIDYKKMASVELATTIQNYQVKYSDQKGRHVVSWVERTYIENEPDDDFEVTYTTVDGEEVTLSHEDQHEICEFVKSFINGTLVVIEEKGGD